MMIVWHPDLLDRDVQSDRYSNVSVLRCEEW